MGDVVAFTGIFHDFHHEWISTTRRLLNEEFLPPEYYLEPGAHVLVPLETSYEQAFTAVPRRWRRVLEE